MNNLLSNTITTIRFPLACGIVFFHLIFNNTNLTIFNTIHSLFSHQLGDLALSTFFTISGFLFFFNVIELNFNTYLHKLKSRLFTLLIPYIFWNLLVLTRLYLSQTLFLNLLDTNTPWLNNLNIQQLIQLIFPINSFYPICYQFWFIRQLIIFSVLSPIFYLTIKYLKLPLILILLSLYSTATIYSFQSIEFRALTFYAIGAYLAIHKLNFLPIITNVNKPLLITYLAILTTTLIIQNQYLHRLSIILGIPTIIALTAYCLKQNYINPNPFLASASFYIYAYHGSLAPIIAKAFNRYLPVQNNLTITTAYLFSEIFIVSLGLILFYLLHKYLPKFTNIICGSR